MKKDMKYVLVRAYSDNDVVSANVVLFKLNEEQINALKNMSVMFEKVSSDVKGMSFAGFTFLYEEGVFCDISEYAVGDLPISADLNEYIVGISNGFETESYMFLTEFEYNTLLDVSYYEESSRSIQLTEKGVLIEGYREGTNFSSEYVDIRTL